MRSAQVPRANGPFELVDKDIPEPGNRQVRIKVTGSVCHSDSFTKEGLFPGIQYPRVPGHEIAGLIDKVGAGSCTQWESGQRVAVGWHGGQDGTCESCRRGDFVTLKIYRYLDSSNSGYEDYMIAPMEALASIHEQFAFGCRSSASYVCWNYYI